MPAQYSCVAGCVKTFGKSASLAHHKKSCFTALELRRKSQGIRGQKGDEGFPKNATISERSQRFAVCFIYLFSPVSYADD